MTKKIFIIAIIFNVFCNVWCNVTHAIENQKIHKKTVSQSTSRENKIRTQNYTQCVKNGTSRSKCYYLYF